MDACMERGLRKAKIVGVNKATFAAYGMEWGITGKDERDNDFTRLLSRVFLSCGVC